MPEKSHFKRDSCVGSHFLSSAAPPCSTQVYCFFFLKQLRNVECMRGELKELGYGRRGLCREPRVLAMRQVKDKAARWTPKASWSASSLFRRAPDASGPVGRAAARLFGILLLLSGTDGRTVSHCEKITVTLVDLEGQDTPQLTFSVVAEMAAGERGPLPDW